MIEFGRDIWIAEGPVTSVAGFRYPTRMAVMRVAGGGLFVWSPVAMSDALRAEVDALGRVRHLVAPNSLHHLYLAEWRKAYPEARMWAAPGLRQRRKDLSFDEELGDVAPPDWASETDQALMRGNAITMEAVFFHRPSGTALFADLLQNFPAGWFKGWRGVVAKLDYLTAPAPTVPRKFRVAFRDRKAARASLARVLAWPIEQVLVAHGTPVRKDGREFVRRAFEFLG